MKRLFLGAYVIYMLALLAACQEDSSMQDGYGYLQVTSVGLDKNLIPQVRTSEVLALDIKQNGVVVKHVDDWTQLQNESLLLPVGNYSLQAYSIEKDSTLQGFDAEPYYWGENNVLIKKNESQTISIHCPITQSLVKVEYSSNFKKAFSSFVTEVSNEYGKVDFSATETRAAFFRSGKPIHALLNVTNTDGKTFTYEKQITLKAEKRYQYKVVFDVTNQGNGSFDFTVDETTHEYQLNITVPLTSSADPALKVTGANAFGQFAYMQGTTTLSDITEPVMFQYKKSVGGVWEKVEAVLVKDNIYEAKTGLLDFATSYQYRMVIGSKVGATEMFTTETFQEIPNLNLDTWTQSGKNWFANENAEDSYWSTGNTGVTSVLAGGKDPITIPVENDDAYKGKAAKMTTTTGVTLVKAAAGNLFIGTYKTNITKPSASVSFGRPYTGARPVALSGYYKYTSMPISHGTKPGNLSNDECNIYVRLWDSNGKEIGFGEFVGKETVTDYQKFSFEITYSDLNSKPAQIAIVATSSHYGGEFDGSVVVGQLGSGSTLWLDELELSYFK